LERWSVTTEAPPLEKFVNIAELISHLKVATGLRRELETRIMHTLLGISLRSEKSVGKVLEAFFSDNVISLEDYAVQEEMLDVLCKDSSRIPPVSNSTTSLPIAFRTYFLTGLFYRNVVRL